LLKILHRFVHSWLVTQDHIQNVATQIGLRGLFHSKTSV